MLQPNPEEPSRTRKIAFAMLGAGTALLVIFAVLQRDRRLPTTKDAGPALSDTPVVIGTNERLVLDAGPQDAGPAEAADVIDAGSSACKVLFGPVEQPFSGPAALSVHDSAVDVATHQNGILHITSFPLDSAGAKRKELPGQPTKSSRPACAAAGDYLFCSDGNGNVHRALHAQASDQIFVHTDAGSRVSAAPIAGGHVALAYLAVFSTTEGHVSQAFVRVDEAEPVRISDEGSGATDVVLAERGDEVVALYVDARLAMSPLHARTISFEAGKTHLGADNVVYVGGGSDHQVLVALGTDSSGAMLGLMPTTSDDVFGLAAVKIESPPKTDEPSEMSLYPNGINTAPIAATVGGKKMYVARVRPMTADATSPHVLELGQATSTGKYTSFGLVASAGSVKDVAIVGDKSGAVWIYYTDQDGSWLEKRACP
ncbi:MAG: hypothetical protein ACRELY_02275 [Polyangiaceae bacterium]